VDAASLLSDLTSAQRKAVQSDASRLCILAGAGSGKTRVLTRRIAYRLATGTVDAGHVLALTFTRRAAAELGERLRALGVRARVTAGTFHAVAYAQLRQFWADRGQPAPQLLDRKAQLLGRLAAERPGVAGAPLAALAAETEWASARLIPPDRYAAEAAAARRSPPVAYEALAALLARYQTEKLRRRLADFDDLLSRLADALESDPAFAAAQRWRWRHLFVDEFQDLNPLQFRLLSAWLGEQPDVCVVGDVNQAVYGWNGADASLLSGLADRWPGTEVIHLDDNHRCTPQVVAAAASVLGGARCHTRSSRADGPPVAMRAYPDDRSEANGVVAEVGARFAAGVPWSQMAVLVRTNAQIGAFEAACRRARVPYRVAGARPLLEDPDIQRVVADLKGRRGDPLAVVAADLAQQAREGAGAEGGAQGRSEGRPEGRAEGQGGGPEADTGAARTAAVATVAGLAADYQRMEGRPTVDGFVSWLGPATSRDRVDDGPGGVTLSTFHRAKGLEWQAVWVAGIEEGLVPIAHAQSEESQLEERRLLYVGLTRAGEELHCSWARERSFGERSMPRNPSPWLAQLATISGTAPPDTSAGHTPRQWPLRLADQRQRLAACRHPGTGLRQAQAAAADPAVLDALRSWRAVAARASGVPAHVLLHDATLTALASSRPTTTEDLLAVPGLGPVKVSRYGVVLLDLVASHRATA
jgi:DNA helicase-2/ATP-dependent DNA helicase PcrA